MITSMIYIFAATWFHLKLVQVAGFTFFAKVQRPDEHRETHSGFEF